MSFKCTVVTPEAQVADETVTQVVLPAHDGEIGILTDRAPLLVKLGTGSLRMELVGGKKREFFIDGGIAQMKDNNLTVVTDDAQRPEEIDVEAAKAEYAEAQALKITDANSFAKRQRALARGTALQRIAQHR